MRSDGVIVLTPASDQDLRLLQRVEDFPVEQFIAQLAVEVLAVVVLPKLSRFDIERLDADPAKPVSNGDSGKFDAIV